MLEQHLAQLLDRHVDRDVEQLEVLHMAGGRHLARRHAHRPLHRRVLQPVDELDRGYSAVASEVELREQLVPLLKHLRSTGGGVGGGGRGRRRR